MTRRSLTMHFLAHPIFAVARDGAGVLRSIEERAAAADTAPASRVVPARRDRSHRRSRGAPIAVRGHRAQHARRARRVRRLGQDARGGAADLRRSQLAELAFDARDVSEAQALLSWMEDRHFTFLGFKEYRLRSRRGQDALEAVEETGLGLLRAGHKRPRSTSRTLASDIRRQSRSRDLVLVTKANLRVLGTSRRLSRLRRREELRRRRPADRRAALSGTVDLVGLQLDAARDSAGTPQGRPRWCSTSRSPPTATTARRCSTSWNPSRGTSCSRRAFPT